MSNMASVQDVISSLAVVAEKALSEPERFQLLSTMDKVRQAIEPPPIALQKICFSVNLTRADPPFFL